MTDGLNDHSTAVARVVLMVGHAKGGGDGGSEYFESHAYHSVFFFNGCSIDQFVTNSEFT